MPRVVYLVTEDWYFVSHRLPMARAARDAGWDVHVVTRVGRHADTIKSEGFVLYDTNLNRGSTRPDHLAAAVLAVRRRYRTIQPDVAHHVAVQAVVIGSAAALGLGVPTVNTVTGLGTMFTSGRGAKSRILRGLLSAALSRRRSVAIVQNPDDAVFLRTLGVPDERLALIAGSGVDTSTLMPLPPPDQPVTFAYAGRMLEDKGVRTLIEAHRLLRTKDAAPRLLLAGTSDVRNPASVPAAEVEAWGREPGITWLGHVDDIADVWQAAHVAVLPSRREGLPKSLLEAAACGRPLIAADVPGSREIARSGRNALLFPVDDAPALARAIETLAGDADLRSRFGAESRRLVERHFSAVHIGRETLDLYARLLGTWRN